MKVAETLTPTDRCELGGHAAPRTGMQSSDGTILWRGGRIRVLGPHGFPTIGHKRVPSVPWRGSPARIFRRKSAKLGNLFRRKPNTDLAFSAGNTRFRSPFRRNTLIHFRRNPYLLSETRDRQGEPPHDRASARRWNDPPHPPGLGVSPPQRSDTVALLTQDSRASSGVSISASKCRRAAGFLWPQRPSEYRALGPKHPGVRQVFHTVVHHVVRRFL